MKFLLRACLVGSFVSLLPLTSMAMLTRPGSNLVGKFYANAVKGDVTVIVGGRILPLKKGDSYPARGAIIETAAGANTTIVFSNGTGVYTDEKTRFIVEKFDQEFFAPNNNLRVEPSNSATVVKLVNGRVVISTPRLLSGTTMYYQTPHAAISIRGEKVLIEATDKQTHVAMIAGNATVNPRDADGNFVSLGKRLVTGQEAFVKFTIAANTTNADEVAAAATAKATAGGAPKTGEPAAVPEISVATITKDTEAVVVRLSGSAHAKLPKATNEITLAEGSTLPAGTLIKTDKDSDLFLEPLKGVIADVRPSTTVLLEKLSVTSAGSVVKHQSAILNLQAGTVVSTIDPALHEINDYGVRTPKGLAKASGTSFTASVEEDGYSIATTADTVTFVTPEGTSYTIKAGQVTITPSGADPQPPIALSAAVAANPAFAADIQGALTAVTTVIQNNLGGLSADSALDLITKVAGTTAAALPDQAVAISTQVIAAVTAPSSATSTNAGVAATSVILAIVSTVPAQASQIAGAAAGAAPAQAVNIAAGAAKAAPGSAAQIASTVAQTFIQSSTGTELSPATIQQAAALAAGITVAAPNQAAPVAAAVMQALAQSAPQSTAQSESQAAAAIAAAATSAAPSQAVPVAATMMKVLTQTSAFTDASSTVITQSAATLASGVSSVVPPQTQEVATAVMQLLTDTYPTSDPGSFSQFNGLVTQDIASNSGGGAGGAGGGNSGQPGATSIFVSNFDPSTVGEVALDLQAAQSAQSNVQFDTTPTPGGGVDIVPVQTTPSKPPPEFVVSPANG